MSPTELTKVRDALARGLSVHAVTQLGRDRGQAVRQRMNLDVHFRCGPRLVSFRVVILPGRAAAMTRLCTDLPRTSFSPDLVARL
jgi:hypothetical protein